MNKAKDKATDVLDTVDDMIAAPLNRLEEAIDVMAEERKPAMDAVALVEKTMHINFPDPPDLKVPLSGCDELLDDFVSKAKLEVPRKWIRYCAPSWLGKSPPAVSCGICMSSCCPSL